MKSDATHKNTHVHDDLKAFCDGELSPWQRLAVRRHLTRCASCREEAQAMQQLHHDLRASSEADAGLPPALRTRILEQLGNAAAQAPPAEPSRPWLLRYGFAASLAANAALIVVLVYTGLLREHRSDLPAPIIVPVVSPQPVPRLQNGPGNARSGGASSTNGRLSSVKSPKPPSHAVKTPVPQGSVPIPSANNGLARMSVSPVSPAPKLSTPQKAQTQSFSAGATAPETYDAAPPLSTPRQARDAATSNERIRAKTPSVLNAPTVTEAPAAPAPPPTAPHAAFGGAGGFGGGGFGGSSFGGNSFSTGDAPPVREAVPGGSAVGRAASPPSALVLPPPAQSPAPGNFAQGVMADNNSAAAAKPAPSSAKTRVEDRATPTPVGAWPTVTLPFGIVPSALGVKSVVVTWDVDDQGQPSHVQFKTTGYAQVDGALRAAIYAGQYQPAMHNGKPIKATLSHTFVLVPLTQPRPQD